ncbi:hypothetical protein [Pedobacter zeae]|uniref:Uncharacterized protein YjhX (UPF0386 family) n=1 Tax=Pedobacter zeae TaxID=1737356 RepID=A0A7W6P600_9SPHI|nr:hypothetical protein [Pedobacter zeae]MBB4107511.1 uncharacterized protein YjhX (UPF0386 family) [Pedobacter zeae]GGG98886.1 hypothetical protein GCM10007422_11360 [Pedobacter zeae]
MKTLNPILILLVMFLVAKNSKMDGKITKNITIDSLGACQGITCQNGRYFLYGDREVGVMREYKLEKDSLSYQHKEYRFTVKGQNIIKHPTGIACHEGLPTFIGNSVRQNEAGTLWKAVINCINWDGFLKTGTLDGNLLRTIDDDACIQGVRPEYVKYKGKWYVATADYGNKVNEVRLMDPQALAKATKTSQKGVVVQKFTCSPWVQNLHFIANKGILVLIQNQVEGRKWRLTFLDLQQSITTGHEAVLSVIDTDKPDELEGFTFTGQASKGIAVSSSRKNNVSFMDFKFGG